jgi:hypothetical protein
MPFLIQATDTQLHAMGHTCHNCAYCLRVDGTSTLRCGQTYFQLSPSERKPMRLDHYPMVLIDHSCSSWTRLDTGVLRSLACG